MDVQERAFFLCVCAGHSSTACLRERIEAGGCERLGATGAPGRHQLLTAARVAAAHLEKSAHDDCERLTVQHRLDGLVVLLLRRLAGGALRLLRGGQAAARAASQWHRGGLGCGVGTAREVWGGETGQNRASPCSLLRLVALAGIPVDQVKEPDTCERCIGRPSALAVDAAADSRISQARQASAQAQAY